MTDAVTIETPAAPAVTVDEPGMEAYARANADRLRYRGERSNPLAAPPTKEPQVAALTQKPSTTPPAEPPAAESGAQSVDNIEETAQVAETEAPPGLEAPVTEAESSGKIPANTKFEDLPAWARREITTAREQKRAADAKAAQAEAERAKLIELIPKPEAPAAEPKPTPEQFDSPEKYDAALIAYGIKQGQEQGRKDAETVSRTAQTRAQADALTAAHNERQTAFMADHADYESVALSDDLPVSIPMAHSIMTADNGPEVLYFLGQNVSEAQRISKMDPVRAAMEIGRISAKLATPPPPPPRAAPKPRPITPVGSNSSPAPQAPEEMTTEQYAAHMREQGRLKYGRRS